MEHVPQHKKLAITGEIGQDISASQLGLGGKSTDSLTKKPSGAPTSSIKKNTSREPRR